MVRFYNKRSTAEQRIKEGGAARMKDLAKVNKDSRWQLSWSPILQAHAASRRR